MASRVRFLPMLASLRRFAPVPLVVLVLAAAGCGDDDGGSSAEKEFVDSAMAQFDAEEQAPLTEENARCIAEAFVEEVGVDELEERGITPESFGDEDSSPFDESLELEEETAEAVVNRMQDCVDLSGLFVDGFTEDADLSDDAVACLAEQFDESAIHDILVLSLTATQEELASNSDLMTLVFDAVGECPEAASAFGLDG